MVKTVKSRKHNWFWLWYVVVLTAVVLPWFLSSGFLFFTDFVWGPHLRLSWDTAPLWKNVFLWFFGLIFSADAVQKIHIVGALAVVLLGGRKIAAVVLKDRRLVLLVSIFTLFNPFVYDRLGYGQINLVAGFGLFLLAFGYLIDYPRRGWPQLALAGLFAGMSIRLSPHFLFLLALVFALGFIATVVKRRKLAVVGHFLLLAGVILVLNSAWIVKSFVLSPSDTPNSTQATISTINRQDLTAFRTSGRTGEEALVNVVMMSGFWGKDQYRYTDLSKLKDGWGRSFVILLPFLVWGVYVGLRKRESRTLTICLLVGYVISASLAVGIRLPVANEVTIWLFDNVPFYKGLRETQKWVAVIVAIYAIFLSLGLRELFRIKIVGENRLASQLFLSGVIIMQAPLILWGMGGQIRPTEYPEDWKQADQRIVELSGCEGATLFLPWHLYMRFDWIGRVVSSPAKSFFTCPTIKGTNMEWGGINDSNRSSLSASVSAWIQNGGQTDLLEAGEKDIRYVLLAKDADWSRYLWLDTRSDIELIEEWPTLKLYAVKKQDGEE